MSGNVMLFGLGTFSSQVPSHPQQAWPATGGAPFLLSQHPLDLEHLSDHPQHTGYHELDMAGKEGEEWHLAMSG